MTNSQILAIAIAQSAADSGCKPSDFSAAQNKVVLSKPCAAARRYLNLPFLCDLTYYGNNIVASVSPDFLEITQSYISKYPACHCFETPNLHIFLDALKPTGASVCFMAEYCLPDVTVLKPLDCPYELKLLQPSDFQHYYLDTWQNALSKKRKELDMLAMGAYHNGVLIGLAGASADCHTMWQIGVDVLPEYQRCGVASALTSRLALSVLERGIVPFYCCAWSNIKSIRNAIKSGFRPAWVQLTIKPSTEISALNNS